MNDLTSSLCAGFLLKEGKAPVSRRKSPWRESPNQRTVETIVQAPTSPTATLRGCPRRDIVSPPLAESRFRMKGRLDECALTLRGVKFDRVLLNSFRRPRLMPLALANLRSEKPDADGAALLGLLAMLWVVSVVCLSLIRVMDQSQKGAGLHLRSVAARHAAEAGVHEALAILESRSSGERGARRGGEALTRAGHLRIGLLNGQFAVSGVLEEHGGMTITSLAEVGGVTRGIRARVNFASPALLAALYGHSVVRFEKSAAATVIGPYGTSAASRPWVHIAAGQEVWFATPGASLSALRDPSAARGAGPGPAHWADVIQPTLANSQAAPTRLLLARNGTVTFGSGRQRIEVQHTRAVGIEADLVVSHVEAFPAPPVVDRGHYRARATANHGNQQLHLAVGAYFGDSDLIRKRDSLYTPREFERILEYLRSISNPPYLQGVIYVRGSVALAENQQLHVVEGAIVVEGTLYVGEDASLRITHSMRTRTLPGVVTLNQGAFIVAQSAQVRVHGLVYVNRVFEVRPGADVAIIGAVVGGDASLSFRNVGARVLILYDPAILGTPGVRGPSTEPVVTWVAAWEELP